MQKAHRIPAALALLVITVVLWLYTRAPLQPLHPTEQDPEANASDAARSGGTGTDAEGASSDAPASIDLSNTDPRFTRFTDGTVHFTQSFTISEALHKGPDPADDLEVISEVLGSYRLVYRENPVGTDNAEIVAQLLGANPKQVFFLPPSHPALSPDGELLDRWGSPYIFHPLKADLMDVRSLGPDRTLWTEDDLSLDLQDAEAELRLHSE